MSTIINEELPPTQNVPIFDNTNFQAGDQALTYNIAKTQFLTFPSAQGTENLLNTNVVGNLSVTNNLTLSGASSNINLSGASGTITFPSGQVQTNSATATFNENTSLSTVSYILTKYYNSTINFTSDRNTQINIITPIVGTYLKIYNNCQYYATLNIDGTKTFSGEWGNSDPTVRLNPNSWSLLYATSTSGWNVIDRSPNQIFDPITISANISYEPHFNLLNSEVYFNPTGNFEVTIPNPQSAFSRNKFINIENLDLINNQITLKISVGLFSGTYGSEANTLILPSNSSIRLYSNGTNWMCCEVSSYGWTYPISTATGGGSTTNINMVYQWFRNYIHINAQSAIFTLPSTRLTAYQEGLVIYCRKILGLTSATTPIVIRANISSSGTQPLFMLNNGQGSYPGNGAFTIGGAAAASLNNFTLRVIKSAIGGSGTCSVFATDPRMINLVPTGVGSFNVGTVLTINGNPYTIRGMGGASAGAIVAAGNATSITSYTPQNSFSSFITVGFIFSVTNDAVPGTLYTVQSITYSTVFGNAVTNYGNASITFSPPAPAGGWVGGTTNVLTGATFGGFSGGLFGPGVYYVDNPVPTGATTYTSASAYSFAVNP